jgi:hypothetical protein
MFVTAASHSARAPFRPRREPSAAAFQALPQRFRLDEVREGPLAVDLDDGDRGTVGRLQLGDAADVDALEIAGAHLIDDSERALAEVAPVRTKDDDSRDTAPA